MKKIILKGTIVIAVFLAALFIISKIMNQGNTDMTVQMAEASFPVVTMKYDGKPVNELHGYDEVMEVNYMRESITPLLPGRKVSIEIDCFGAQIREIAYEVRSIDGERLVESTKVQEFTQQEDKITASFGLKDLIDSEKEYVLVILLTTEDGKEIRYYTRIFRKKHLTKNRRRNSPNIWSPIPRETTRHWERWIFTAALTRSHGEI